MIPTGHEPDAAALAAALRELLTVYPTDAPDAPHTTLSVRGPDGHEHRLQATPGQVEWLTRLLTDEAATCRNAHPDGSGRCAHCNRAGSDAPNTGHGRP